REVDSPALAMDFAQQQLEDLAEGIDLRATELVDAPDRRRIFEAFDYGVGNVADIDRLKPGFAAADQRQHRGDHRHRRKAVEELILGTEHDRRAQYRDGWKGVAHRLLAGRLGSGIGRGRTRIGADRRNMDEALDPGLPSEAREPGRAGMVDQIE